MKRLVKLCLVVLLPGSIAAQKDSLKLLCPLDEAVVVPPPKNAIKFDPPDLCIVLTSIPDTVVKACVAARVTNIEVDEEGRYGVVLFSKHNGKDYYFWYSGLSKASVRRLENVKAGQTIGFMKPGDKIEMLMFDFETPVDPTRYLDCKGVLKVD